MNNERGWQPYLNAGRCQAGRAIAAGYGLSQMDDYLKLLPAIVLLNVGQGMTWTAMWVCASEGIPSGQQGVASTVQQIGGALGLAVRVSVANAAGDSVDGLN